MQWQVRPLLATEGGHAARAGARAAECSWNGDGLVADVVQAALDAEAETVARLTLQQVLPHVCASAKRRGSVEVHILVNAGFWSVYDGRAEAANAAHQRIHHGLHKGAGDCRVDRAPACPQDFNARLGRFRLRTAHHSFAAHVDSCIKLSPRRRWPAAASPGGVCYRSVTRPECCRPPAVPRWAASRTPRCTAAPGRPAGLGDRGWHPRRPA